MQYFVYILQSESSGKYYIGSTDNLERRISEHQRGKTPATRNRGPWKLLYTKTFISRSEAVKWEMAIKRKKSAESIRRIISCVSE